MIWLQKASLSQSLWRNDKFIYWRHDDVKNVAKEGRGVTVNAGRSDGVVNLQVDEKICRDVGQEGADEADDHGVQGAHDGARSQNKSKQGKRIPIRWFRLWLSWLSGRIRNQTPTIRFRSKKIFEHIYCQLLERRK